MTAERRAGSEESTVGNPAPAETWLVLGNWPGTEANLLRLHAAIVGRSGIDGRAWEEACGEVKSLPSS